MTTEYLVKRNSDREPYDGQIDFTVLFMDSYEFMRVDCTGMAVDASKAGLGLITKFPLEPGQVVEWDDRHAQGRLHIALVRWSRKMGEHYRAGVMFI